MNTVVLDGPHKCRWNLSDYNPQNPEHTRPVTVRCKRCGCDYQLDAFYAEVFGAGICDSCGRIVRAEEEAARLASVSTPERRFAAIAPRLFFEGQTATNPKRAGFPKEAYDRALMWNPTGMGLILCGPSGAGKSRILWALLRRLIVEDRKPVEILQGGDFRQRLIEAYRADRSEIVIDRLSRVPVLAWDDFGQDALKEGMETDLRAIIDYRYREGLPMLLTTQFSPTLLSARLSGGNSAREEVCASIVRRITSRCEVIEL
jgi:DNA replication protein DnaC